MFGQNILFNTIYIVYFAIGVFVLAVAVAFVWWYDQSRRPVSGKHALLGQVGRAKQAIPAGKIGKVYIFGEYWEGICDEDLAMNQAVKVIEVHEKFVKVIPSESLPDRV
jgi:membrane protein implicated in regulation of membrane protease activity